MHRSTETELNRTAGQGFEARFGRAPDAVAFAPGRVNLMGEHTDYNGGVVLPMPLGIGVSVALGRGAVPGELRLSSAEYADEETRTVDEPATGAWWMTEPISLIQTNLRETDSGLDGAQLVREVKAFPANTILFSVGGITAHYPTDVPFHFRSDYLPEGKDLVGEVLDEAHRSEIRIIGRFDFSRARKAVYDAHPEWFYAQKDGSPVVDDNDLYSVCINGGYYNEKALEILAEALGRYDLDGLFFNWFGNITSDYKGNYIGLCHCGVCESGFRARFGRSIPDKSDKDYDAFMFDSKMAVAKKIRDLIREKRPKALFMTYIDDYTDGIVTEADFYKWRALRKGRAASLPKAGVRPKALRILPVRGRRSRRGGDR